MEVEDRKIFFNTGVMYARLIITTVIGLLISRYVLQALGASDYGLYAVVGGLITMLNVISTGMHTTTRRFVNVEMGKSDGNLNRIFNISRLVHIGFAFFILLVAETIGIYYIYHFLNVSQDKFGDAIFVFQVSTIASAIGIINVPYQALIEAYEKFSIGAFISIMDSIIKLTFVIALIYYQGNVLRIYAVGMSLLTLLNLCFYNIVCFHKWKDVVKYKLYKGWSKYKEIIYFNNYVSLGATSYLSRTQGSTLLVNYFYGTVINAAFAIGYLIENYCIMFVNNIGLAAGPQITRNYENNYERSFELTTALSRYSTYMMLILVVPFSLELDFILHLWLKEVPEGTQMVCHLTLLSALVRVAVGDTSKIVQASGRIRWFQIIGSIIELSCLPVSYILFLQGCHAYTVIVVYILSSLVNRVSSLFLLHRILSFDIWKFVRQLYIPVGMVLGAISLFVLLYTIVISLEMPVFIHLLGICMSVVITSIVAYSLGLRTSERGRLNQFVSQKTKKIYEILSGPHTDPE